MTQISYFWDGTAVGDAASVTELTWSKWISIMFQQQTYGFPYSSREEAQGIIKGNGSEFAISQYGQGYLLVGSGAALVAGFFYENTGTVIGPYGVAPEDPVYYQYLVIQLNRAIKYVQLYYTPFSLTPVFPLNTDNLWRIPVALITYTRVTIDGVNSIDTLITDKRNFCTFGDQIP